MNDTSRSDSVSTKLVRIAELASKAPDMKLTTLSHHIDMDFMHEAYMRTRKRKKKKSAVGVDGQSMEEFEENLEENLKALLDGLKSGSYKAPPVKRAYIPKAGSTKVRKIGIPTTGDKVLQRAVHMVLEAVYEQDFCSSSYGFRPGRSPHSAVKAVWKGLMDLNGGWVIDADITNFFDEISHQHLRAMLDQRVRDGVLRRMIDKWLKAGVFEQGQTYYPEDGTPQGGVISPLLANIFLHHVVDLWFENTVKPLLDGRAFLVRFADDVIIVTENERDARRIMKVLPKRFGKFGLRLHPEKTKLIPFIRPPYKTKPSKNRTRNDPPNSFDFLGFTHFWGLSRRGTWTVKRKTAKKRIARTLKKIALWCKYNRSLKVKRQRNKLEQKLRGHYVYFGINGNFRSLNEIFWNVKRIWKKWLCRRSQKARKNWKQYHDILKRFPLPKPKIYHSEI